MSRADRPGDSIHTTTERVSVTIRFDVDVKITDETVINRVTANKNGWRDTFYASLRTRDDVLRHLAVNAVLNRVCHASALDGWADLADDACTMVVVDEEVERFERFE
jgi:hypothetical protein